MQQNTLIIILGIIIWIVIWYLIAKIYFRTKIKKQRQEAVSRSRSVLLWNVNEKIAPLLPNFPYHYKDLTFVWKWIDYIVFDWLSSWNLKQIVFLEIKSWNSNLNRNERMIQNCIKNKNIKYNIYRL